MDLGPDDKDRRHTYIHSYTFTRILAPPCSQPAYTPTLILQSPTAYLFAVHNNPPESVHASFYLPTRLSDTSPRPRGCPGTGTTRAPALPPGSPSTSLAPRCSLPRLACCETRRHFSSHPQPRLPNCPPRQSRLESGCARRCACGLGCEGFGLSIGYLAISTARAIPGRRTVGLVTNYAYQTSTRR